MLAILGSLIGLLGSSLPALISILQAKHDRAHELAIMKQQITMQKLLGCQTLEEIQMRGDYAQTEAAYKFANYKTGIRWVEALQQSVRPIITYTYFMLFAVVKLGLAFIIFKMMFNGEIQPYIAFNNIWDEESMAIFAGILSFWFGNRGFEKIKNSQR